MPQMHIPCSNFPALSQVLAQGDQRVVARARLQQMSEGVLRILTILVLPWNGSPTIRHLSLLVQDMTLRPPQPWICLPGRRQRDTASREACSIAPTMPLGLRPAHYEAAIGASRVGQAPEP